MVVQQSMEIFVNEEESLILEALAQAEAPHSQRAQALLAVDAGSTLEQAAQVANLKVTQVRYWLGRFKNGRLGVFPDDLIRSMEKRVKAKSKEASPEKKKKKSKKPKKAKSKPAAAKKGEKKAAKAKAKKAKKEGSIKTAKAKKKKSAKKSGKKKK